MAFFPHDVGSPIAAPRPAVDWEEADCLLCGQRDWLPLIEAQDPLPGGNGLWFVVVQCQKCGLCFTNPRPTLATMDSFYLPSYSPHQGRSPSKCLADCDSIPAKMPRRYRNPFSALKPGRLLDFGCGSGRFIQRMRQRGWRVTGLDSSPNAIELVRNQLGLNAMLGSLPHPDLRSGSFDLITMWHSLEHVHAPLSVLRDAFRLLAPGGKLHVAVPNIDSLPFRWFGSTWFGLDVPRHLTHFAPWTLHLMLERAGFRVGPIEMVRHSKWLRCSAQRACERGPQPAWRRSLQNRSLSRLVSRYCSFVHQSDCMVVTAEALTF